MVKYFLCCLLAFSLSASVFVPQPSSSAGVIEREIQKEYDAVEVSPEREVPDITIDLPTPELSLQDWQKIRVDKIQFVGNTVFSDEELQAAICSGLDNSLCMKDIRTICTKVRAKYLEEGYFLTRVYPPAQEINNHTLKLEIIEGKLGEITVIGNQYYSTSFIKKYFAPFQEGPLQYNAFMKALFLLNENSDVQAGAIFKKGTVVGTADVIIRITDKRPAHLYFNFNNYGSHFNSLYRTGSRIDYGNLFKYGDMLSLTGVVGSPVRILQFFNLDYQIPVWVAKGTKLHGSILLSKSQDPQRRPFKCEGSSEIGSIGVEQPIQRTRSLSTDLTVAFDIKTIKNFIDNSTATTDNLREFRCDFSIDYFDSLDGRNLAFLGFVQGIPHFLGASPSVSSHSSRLGGGGLFSILYLNYTRLQKLPQSIFLTINFNSQYSPYKLPLAEQFYIGGMGTVRGYPLAIGLGDFGYFLNLEATFPPFGIEDKKVPFMKKTWREFFQWFLFIDNGQTYLNAKTPNEIRYVQLTSAGLGVRLFAPQNFDFYWDLAFPITPQERKHTVVNYVKLTWRPF
jgi:hemolysin activation/secretion protein